QVESAFAFDECVDFALTRRPDLMQLRIGLASQKIALDVAKNQLKPRFDFSASIALTGMSYDYGEHFEGMVRGDYYAFKLGFDLEYPIGNRAAQAGLRKAESDFSKTKIALLAAEQGVILQVRNLVRTVRTNYRRINSAIIARRLAEQSLSEEQDRYGVGRSTAIEVLRLQTDLIAAQNTELQAIIDYNVSIAQLNRARAANALLYRVEVDSQREPVLALPSWDETAPDKPLIKASSQNNTPNK
ncbi:MAG: TolC family protein, partial [Candidatus Brocadiia bacterium]